jgi:hypothetical protein
MRNIFIYITIVLSLFISCKEEVIIKEVDADSLKESIIMYLDSSKQTIENISGIFSNIKEPSANYNKITVESIQLNNRKHFVVLLEHPIPVFNLFAVLDDSLNLLLRDNSINGHLRYAKLNNGNTDYLQLTEDYKSLDVFNLTRLSIYKKIGDKIRLVFRGHIAFNSPKDSVVRNITAFNDSTIVCSIPKSKLLVKDVINYKYYYDNLLKLFSTEKDFMDTIIVKEINNFSAEFSPSQILNKKSYMDIIAERLSDSLEISKAEYEFSIPPDWTLLDNISFYKILKKKVKGNFFVNKSMGVNIGIIKIPDLENSEDYVNASFTVQKQLRDYQIRESVVQEDIKYFSQAIEHQCGGKKYLLIIEGSKNAYRKNQEYFKNILASFAINCD